MNLKENNVGQSVSIDSQGVLYSQGNNDECYTPAYGVKPIIKYMPKGKIIRCPFDKEDSQFVIQLKEEGYDVVHSHIDDGKDFYNYEPEERDILVSNPPFTFDIANKRIEDITISLFH